MGGRRITDVDAHIGKRIRMRRMQLGLSQEKVVEKIGVTFQQLQKYENGKNGVRGSRLVALAAALDTTPAFFFDGLDAGGKVAKGGSIETDFFTLPHATDLASAFVRLASADERRLVSEIATALADKSAAKRKAA